MDVSLMENPSNIRSEGNLESQPNKALLVWGPCELTDNGKKRESRKCHHFSIRGYVSEVRKTNIQLCWPFREIDNQYKVEEHADLLPPMTLTESRWWGCRSCLQKAHILEVGGQNEETINCQGSDNRRLEIGGTPFNRIPEAEMHVCVPTLLSEFQRTQGQSTFERNSVGNDVLTNLKDGHLRPSLCHHEKGKISIDTGICNYGVHLSTSDAIQSLLSETPSNGHLSSMDLHNEETSASKIREIATLETHETGVLQCENMALQGQNICNTMITELEERTPGFGVSETELNSSTLPFETNKAHVFGVNDVLGFRKNAVFEKREPVEGVNSSLQRSNNYDIKGLEIEEVNHGASECMVDPVQSKDDSPSCPSTSDIINGNLHRRKARKVRTLNDIMKSEVLGLSRQSNLSTGNDSVQYRDERAMVIAAPRNGKSVADINLNLAPRERESESLETMKRKELQESEDEDPSLIHWLRRIPKKLKTQKYGEEENTANNAVISSQAVPQLSDKCLRSNIRESVTILPKLGECRTVLDGCGKTLVNESPPRTTHTGSVHSRITLQKGMNNGYCPVIEDQNAKYINTGNAPQKLAIRNDMLYSHREQLNGPQKDIMIHGKKEIMQEVANGVPSSLSALKKFSGTSTYEKGTQHSLKRRSVRGRKGPTEEVMDDAPVICEVAALGKIQTREEQGITPIKRRMTAPLCEKKTDPTTLSGKQAVIDGIPIEILELLQSNYHKNHQPNTQCPTERMIENHLNSEHSNVRIVEPFNATKTLRDCSLLKLTNITEPNPDSLPLLQNKSKVVPCKNVTFGNGAAYAVDEHTGTSNPELRARTSIFSVKQRQVDPKEVQRPAAFPDPPDVRLCLAPPSGAQPNMESTKSHFPLSYNWNRVLLQNEVSNYNALPIPRQQHCRCYPHSGIQVNNSYNIHPGIYNTNLLPQVRLPENDPSKATRSDSGMQITDTSFTQLHNVKQKNIVKSKRTPSLDIYRKAGKTVKDCSSKVSEPLDLYTNDSIPAMHLLRLIDPAVGSATSPLDPTMSSGQEDFVGSKRFGNGSRKDFVETGEEIKARCPFKCVGLSENHVYNQKSSSNLMLSAPRYGAVESLSHKRSLPGSNIFDVPYEFKRKNPTDAFLRKTGGKGKKKSYLGVQQRPSEQGPLFGARRSQDQLWSILNSPDYLKVSEARENLPQVEYKHTEESMSPASGSCKTELCVVNRNPADFSILDENNVYMISYEDLQPRYHPPKRRKQKVMHLDTPKRQKIQQKILKLAASEWNLRC